jgi:(1->4)-alpha-D-glucan 1-alpha-D-glucosylmutase
MKDENSIRETFDKVASELPLRVPVSTYRLQFNQDFTFADAGKVIPYLNSIGITDVYASPYFRAQPGSKHGYDVIDHNALNPEVGTLEDYEAMNGELRRLGMGHIADIVPNHMSITGSGNTWWNDVLENGRCSPYAQFFDIDWKPIKEELEDRVILPILGGLYGDILEEQQIRLVFEEGAFFVRYWEHRLPIDPSTYERVLTHRQDDLREALGLENKEYQEFLSIVTSLKNLPTRLEEDSERIAERMREKEIAKKRLLDLYNASEAFRAYLDENINIFNGTQGEPESFDRLDGLLSAQVYRLSFWRVATEEINYRRFFDINDLGAIRMEDERVFNETHRLVFDLIGRGMVSGLRVDHPDGLHNPKEYFKRLQEGCFIALCMARLDDGNGGDAYRELYREGLGAGPDVSLRRPLFVIGEKILMESEKLSPDWPIFGTTGYGFMNAVNALFIDSANAKEINGIYSRFSKQTAKFPELFYAKKKLIMETSMSSEINALGWGLNRISERDRHYRDFTLNNLIDALVEVIAFFPVYRTYISPAGVSETDRHYIETAISRARRRGREINPLVFDFIRDVLLLNYPLKEDPVLRRQCMDFTMKFQQLTGPVMAKGIEDTVFYTYNRLMSLNEVGGNPERLGMTVDAFHTQNTERQQNWPHTLLATSTHDSKRGEDVRARINVISELTGEWKDCIIRWARMNRKFKRNLEGQPVPDRNEEYLLYQTLIGAWPIEQDDATLADFKERIKQYMVKAVREAKTNSSWLNPNMEYEEALLGYIDKVLGAGQFLDDLRPFRSKVSNYGMFNSLSQTLVKITSPGVPDFYQGSELWTLTLVDPDNRRPVDYGLRTRLLEELKGLEASMGRAALAQELLSTKEDGRIKLHLTYIALNFRRDNGGLFTSGQYVPLQVTGRHAERIVAFGHFGPDAAAITVAPRLLAGLAEAGEPPVGGIWDDTAIHLPPEMAASGWQNVLTDESVGTVGEAGAPVLRMSEVLARFPVALLSRQ